MDLFAGSGGLAIEAVSRGMDKAVLIDKAPAAIKVIQENIAVTKEEEKFKVIRGDAARVINNLKSEQQVFDLVFLDPPYAKQQIVSQIEALLDNNMLSPEALIVCEVDKKVDLPETIKQAQVYKSAEYGITKIMIYELVSQEEGENE